MYINKLSNSKSTGFDKVSAHMLKFSCDYISPHLTALINLIIKSGKYPKMWNEAKIIPIYKGKGSKSEPLSYRPISLLSVISKACEMHLHKNLYDYFESNNLLNERQFGFRKLKSTTDALLNIQKCIFDARNNKEYVCVYALDGFKAFDSVNHNILLSKLSSYGLQHNAIKLIDSYLANRKQAIMYENKISSVQDVRIGVPQGSVISSLLFLIFINDIFNLDIKGEISLYADDITVIFKHKSAAILDNIVIEGINKVLNWFTTNRIIVNKSKSNYMMIGFRDDKHITNEMGMLQSKSIQILGIEMDNKLSIKQHIEKIENKLRKVTGILRRLNNILTTNIRILLYKTLFRPIFLYASQVWSFTYQTHLNGIENMNKRFLKLLSSQSFINFKSHKILEFNKLLMFYNVCYIHKFINSQKFFKYNFFKYKTQTRISRTNYVCKLEIPFCTVNYTQNSIFYKGCKQWNDLNDNIRLIVNFNSFKSNLLNYLL